MFADYSEKRQKYYLLPILESKNAVAAAADYEGGMKDKGGTICKLFGRQCMESWKYFQFKAVDILSYVYVSRCQAYTHCLLRSTCDIFPMFPMLYIVAV